MKLAAAALAAVPALAFLVVLHLLFARIDESDDERLKVMLKLDDTALALAKTKQTLKTALELAIDCEENHKKSVAVTAVFELPQEFHLPSSAFHEFCAARSNEALFYADHVVGSAVDLISYSSKPAEELGKQFMTCHWTVTAAREGWCRNQLTPAP